MAKFIHIMGISLQFQHLITFRNKVDPSLWQEVIV